MLTVILYFSCTVYCLRLVFLFLDLLTLFEINVFLKIFCMFFVIFCDFYELRSILVGECWPPDVLCFIDELNVTVMLTTGTHKV